MSAFYAGIEKNLKFRGKKILLLRNLFKQLRHAIITTINRFLKYHSKQKQIICLDNILLDFTSGQKQGIKQDK